MSNGHLESSQLQPFRRRTLWSYLLIGLLMLLSAGYAVDQLWQSYRDDTLMSMRRDAYRTSQLVDATVQDATKVLDIAKSSLESALRQGPVDQRQAHAILRRTTDRLSMPGSVVSQGLLFAIDQHGTIYARNSQYPAPPLHVADRLYFRRLQADPAQRFVVGNLTIGRADRRVVFHVAEPLLDANARFVGVVLQQIPGFELQQALATSVGKPRGTLLVLLDPQHCVFAYPMPADPDRIEQAPLAELYALAQHPERDANWLAFTNGDGRDYLVFAKSTLTGLLTVESLSQRKLLLDFLRDHLRFLGLSALAAGAILLLLLLHYRQTTRLFFARNASLLDELTGLPNRRALDERFPLLWREALRQHASISALFIDIDHFKRFNDQHGHVCADQALKQVAHAIRDCLRRPFDFACRWGGEEFVVLLPQTDAHGAMLVAEAVLHKVREIVVELGDAEQAGVSVSIGVSSLRVTPDHFENDLIDLADKAMLTAKAKGRDQIYLG